MSSRTTRRVFLRQSAGAAVGTLAGGVPALARGGSNRSPNDKLGIGMIGVGGRGLANLLAVRGERIVAICDVDERQSAEPRNWVPKAKFYTNFRRMFDQKDIDAIVVSTPDHTHAPAVMMALEAGKHVYCEKPLTHSVYEARRLTEMAAKQKAVTQMGIQVHAGRNYRRIVEMIRSGAIGNVAEVHVWHRGGYAPGDRPQGTPPVPKGLHYDEWLGPAPYRPYHPAYVPNRWRGWWDFGGGLLGDFGCHLIDLAHWALDLRHVRAVSAQGPRVHPDSTPAWTIIRYEYPSRPGRPPVNLTWYNGRGCPGTVAKKDFSQWKMGVLFVGEKGRLVADLNRYVLLPEGESAGPEQLQPFLPDSSGHYREWIQACKTDGKTTCSFDYSGPLTETVLLGNVAYRAGRPIEWDAKNLRITNEPEAMRFIRRPYRKGWAV
jgi:predicted dehydrogenase